MVLLAHAWTEEEARNVRDVADVIEEERGKVDGKTPINEEVFQVTMMARLQAFARAASYFTHRADDCPRSMVHRPPLLPAHLT